MAPMARKPGAPLVPPAPSTTAPPSTPTTAVKAPPTSTKTNEVASQGRRSRRAWSHTPSATAQSLSAVPMSMRLTLR